ncbi:MAG TPA: hypothetical protein VD966_00100 [Pyrinomonadaceae bacterium]|nr:hypothetical protein [Pyrinomonadaceae bacterium]
MVQIDVPVAFAIGSFFADAARKQLRTGQAKYFYETLALNNIYQSFFFSWIPVYFMLNYFGWETTHMWWHADSITAYPFFVPIFLVVFFAAANGGFLLGYWLVRRGRLATNRAIYLGVLVYSAVWILAQTNSTLKLGTYTQWKNGQAPWFYEDSTFVTMLVFTLIVWGGGLAYFAIRLRNEGRRAE